MGIERDPIMDEQMRKSKKDKPFPWGCTCGQEQVMPDGPALTCRNCGTQWHNSYDEENKYGASQSSDEYARMYCDLHREKLKLENRHARLVEAVKLWFQDEPKPIQEIAGIKVYLQIPISDYLKIQQILGAER